MKLRPFRKDVLRAKAPRANAPRAKAPNTEASGTGRKLKVLWMSEFHRYTTSPGIISKEMLTRFHAREDIEVLEFAQDIDFWPEPSPWQTVFCSLEDPLGKNKIGKVMASFAPDCLVTFSDPLKWMHILQLPQRQKTKIIGWWPQEAGPVSSYYANLLQQVDKALVPHASGKKLLCEAFTGNATGTAGNFEDKIDVLGHGIDPTIFRPSRTNREKLRTVLGYKDSDIVFFCNSRNLQRKQLPALIRAFALGQAIVPDMRLLLHCKTKGPAEAYDLDEIVAALSKNGLNPKSVCCTNRSNEFGFDPKILTGLYQAADVYVTTAISEAFCFPVLEAFASKVPVIATRGVGPTDDWLDDNRGVLVDPAEWIYFGNDDNTLKPITNVKAFGEAMAWLAKDELARNRFATAGFKFFGAQDFSWDTVFSKLLQHVTSLTIAHGSEEENSPVAISGVVL